MNYVSEYGFITGPWSGILNLVITVLLGMLVILIGIVFSEKYGKQYAPFIMIGVMAGLQVMVGWTSSKDVAITFAGQEFYIVAGSLMYVILPLGEDFLNEFYGPKVARTAVLSQFIIRLLTTLYLLWLVILPPPTWSVENYSLFKDINIIVPRVAIASIIGTYIGGMINVRVFAHIKKLTEGKRLWLRTFGSTFIGLLVNGIIFNILAFAFARPWHAIGQMILLATGVRLAGGILELVFMYICHYLKRIKVIGNYEAIDLVKGSLDSKS